MAVFIAKAAEYTAGWGPGSVKEPSAAGDALIERWPWPWPQQAERAL
jgi:hypothetical protein